MLALDRIDDVVDLVRKAKDAAAAKAALTGPAYNLSEQQASAILALTLGRSVVGRERKRVGGLRGRWLRERVGV